MESNDPQVIIYLVGGTVRDRLRNIPSKDRDYVIEAPSYEYMKEWIIKQGGTIYTEKKEYQTLRAKINKEVSDFSLCRGTLKEDLSHRDFTVNAMAMNKDGKLFDPYFGQFDLINGVLKCVGDAKERFIEDPLRMLRAIRFYLTHNLIITPYMRMLLLDEKLCLLLNKVSIERKREEIYKCFACDTHKAIMIFGHYPQLCLSIFKDKELWLEATTKKVK
jgi:tRNA nucleotidyltransferase (CCA-adding enzyme)